MRKPLWIFLPFVTILLLSIPARAAQQLDCFLYFGEPQLIYGFSTGEHRLYDYVDYTGSVVTCAFDGAVDQVISINPGTAGVLLTSPGGLELTPDRNGEYTLPETGLYTVQVRLHQETETYQKCDESGLCEPENYYNEIFYDTEIVVNLLKGEATAPQAEQQASVSFDLDAIDPLPNDTIVYSASFTSGSLLTGTEYSSYKLFRITLTEDKVIQLTEGNGDDIEPDVSPDGKLIAFMSDLVANSGGDEEIYVISVDGGQPVRLTNNRVTDARPVWSPDNRQIAFMRDPDGAGYFDIMVMNADGSNLRQLTQGDADDRTPGWSPDGQQIVFASDRSGNDEIYVMNADGSNIQQLTDNTSAEGRPAFSPDGSKIIFNTDRAGFSEIWMMDADGSHEQLVVTTDPQYATTFAARWSPDGQHIIFHVDSSFLGVVAIGSTSLDGKTYEPVASLYQGRGDVNVFGLDWVGSADTPVLASTVPEAVVINAPALEAVNVITTPGGFDASTRLLEFTPDHETLVVGGSIVGSSFIQLIDTATGDEQTRFETKLAAVSADGQRLLVPQCDVISEYNECLEPVVHLIDVASGKKQISLGPIKFGSEFTAVAFSADGQTVAGGYCITDGSTCTADEIRLWDASSGEELMRLKGLLGTFMSVEKLVFSRDGTRLLALHEAEQGNGQLQLWDVTNQKVMFTTDDDNFVITPDWSQLAAFSCETPNRSCTVHLLDTTSGDELTVIQSAFSAYPHIALSPDGTLLAVADWQGGIVEVWNTGTGEKVNSFQTGITDFMAVMVFSPTSAILGISGCPSEVMNRCAEGQGGAELWNAATGEPLAVIRGHIDTAWVAGFSPDGTQFATLGTDEIRIWNVPTVNQSG